MLDVISYISKMNRPRLLVRAARIGAQEYRRDMHLPRLLGLARLPKSADALLRLSEIETELNAKRLSDDAGYSLTRHIDVLIAMVAEARLLRAATLRVV
ncbi:MAG: DUF6477 family protein [Paracoccaceae bacterium]